MELHNRSTRVDFHFVDLPDGIIQFTATPKQLYRSTFVSPEEISDISGMLTNLHVGMSDKSTSDSARTSITPNKKRLCSRNSTVNDAWRSKPPIFVFAARSLKSSLQQYSRVPYKLIPAL